MATQEGRTTAGTPGVAGRRLSTYERWIQQEGVPIVEGYGVEDVTMIPRRPWPRLGGQGAFIDLAGMEGITGMYVAEIPPRGALNPEKHLYEELIYILQGKGATEIWSDGQAKQVFEWGEGSLFSPPLNSRHRLYNGSNEPVFLLSVTNAPIAMDIFHSSEFIFTSQHVFTDRYDGRKNYFEEGPRVDRGVGYGVVWNTNFIPNVKDAEIDPEERKGAGVLITVFEMSDNALVGHMAEWPVGRYHKAHYHGGGAVLLIVKSKGYTLMWPRDLGIRPYEEGHGDKVIRVDWKEGSVVSPPTAWFHQHFNTGPRPARQLALRYGSTKHRVRFHNVMSGEGVYVNVKEGGTLIEYEDEDPQIRRDYEAALRREGIACQMPTQTT